LEEGLAWGKAKDQLFELVEAELAPMRSRYDELIASPGEVEEILQRGATRARDVAAPLMHEVRQRVGLGAVPSPCASYRPSTRSRAIDPPRRSGSGVLGTGIERAGRARGDSMDCIDQGLEEQQAFRRNANAAADHDAVIGRCVQDALQGEARRPVRAHQ